MTRRRRFQEPMTSLNVKISGDAKAKLFRIAGQKSLGLVIEEMIRSYKTTVTLPQGNNAVNREPSMSH